MPPRPRAELDDEAEAAEEVRIRVVDDEAQVDGPRRRVDPAVVVRESRTTVRFFSSREVDGETARWARRTSARGSGPAAGAGARSATGSPARPPPGPRPARRRGPPRRGRRGSSRGGARAAPRTAAAHCRMFVGLLGRAVGDHLRRGRGRRSVGLRPPLRRAAGRQRQSPAGTRPSPPSRPSLAPLQRSGAGSSRATAKVVRRNSKKSSADLTSSKPGAAAAEAAAARRAGRCPRRALLEAPRELGARDETRSRSP